MLQRLPHHFGDGPLDCQVLPALPNDGPSVIPAASGWTGSLGLNLLFCITAESCRGHSHLLCSGFCDLAQFLLPIFCFSVRTPAMYFSTYCMLQKSGCCTGRWIRRKFLCGSSSRLTCSLVLWLRCDVDFYIDYLCICAGTGILLTCKPDF
jgi:hypothetical protein